MAAFAAGFRNRSHGWAGAADGQPRCRMQDTAPRWRKLVKNFLLCGQPQKKDGGGARARHFLRADTAGAGRERTGRPKALRRSRPAWSVGRDGDLTKGKSGRKKAAALRGGRFFHAECGDGVRYCQRGWPQALRKALMASLPPMPSATAGQTFCRATSFHFSSSVSRVIWRPLATSSRLAISDMVE